MTTWILVLWLSSGGTFTTVPGYSSREECAEAAKELHQMTYIGAICIPGPTVAHEASK